MTDTETPDDDGARRRVRRSKLTFHRLDWLEGLALVLGICFLVLPKPYNLPWTVLYTLLFTVLLVLPVVGLVLNGRTGRPSIASLVRISYKYGWERYDVADFIDFPALAILCRVWMDFEFEGFYSLLIPGTVAVVLMLVLLFATHRPTRQSLTRRLWIYGSLAFNILLYSYSAAYGMNCVYDYSQPRVYEARVISKHVETSGKGFDRYCVRIAPWGHHHDPETLTVSMFQYDGIREGQTVKMDLKQGLFGIPWYYLE
jgi:hypothetical protein